MSEYEGYKEYKMRKIVFAREFASVEGADKAVCDCKAVPLQARPRHIHTQSGQAMKIVLGDFICTDKKMGKYPVPKKMFNEMYELAEVN